jgi:hypothetical protein
MVASDRALAVACAVRGLEQALGNISEPDVSSAYCTNPCGLLLLLTKLDDQRKNRPE